MPNRYIREAAIRSRGVNQLSWQAEVFWRRLLNVVDDFGRHHADPELLRADVFPRQLEKVRVADIERLIAECEKAVLLFRYEADSKPFLVLNQWETGRAKKSRWPDPPANIGLHLQTHSYEGIPMSPSPSPSPSQTPTPPPVLTKLKSNSLPGGYRGGLTNGHTPGEPGAALRGTIDDLSRARLAQDIVNNRHGWYYDNCELHPQDLIAASLRTILKPCVGQLPEARIVAAWAETATRTHRAVVDGMEIKTSLGAYAVGIFKEQLDLALAAAAEPTE
jgi:hypothetical protein